MAAPLQALRSRIQRLAIGPRLAAVKLLVCDVDGVLTDGGLYYEASGGVTKRFNVRDGLAIRMLQRAGIEVALLSGGRSGAIEHRARHLQICHCRAEVGDKLLGLRELQAELDRGREATAFIGDDLNDLAVRPATALLVAPADAARGLRQRADWVLRSHGGHGAVRELAEALLESRGALAALHRDGWREGNG
jgi:3-deoxy-D-manno-octulosonate 8-phosphate phosphatase (KDO 8-P phosphatase)